MATRRMFSKTIVQSDAFLNMPASSRLLYYDLGMNADDDGFVQARMVMAISGAKDDDYNILLVKGFLIEFEDKVVVIRDWKINNEIRIDRYRETFYLKNKSLLSENSQKQYILNSMVVPMVVPNDNRLDTQVRIGKDRLGKVSIGKDNKNSELSSQIQQVFDVFYKTINPTLNYANKTSRQAAEWMVNKWGLDAVVAMAEYACSIHGQPYAPIVTTPYELKDKISKIKAFKEKQEIPFKGLKIGSISN